MVRQLATCVFASLICIACDSGRGAWNWQEYQPPDWRQYRAREANVPNVPPNPSPSRNGIGGDRFTFGDLKSETDESLARRLLGEAGGRIAYIDRYWRRWNLYNGDDDGAERIDLYTRPYALGSQYGLCGVEKYSVEFDDEGRIRSVTVSQRYGVEGPIFQKSDFDWEHYSNVMCASVPATHAPSYFPATDSIMADRAAELLIVLFDLAASSEPLPFSLECRAWEERRDCGQGIREYLGQLRLEEIDEFSLVNCSLEDVSPHSVCFTITTGVHQIGPFPKHITVRGSTYMNNVRLDSVEVLESFTVS